MEWKVSREKLPVTEIILDEVQEQDFAQGLVLPDYDPEIFRVISCEAEPSVTGWQLQGNRLTYELCVELRVLYCGSESKAIHSVSQIMTYSKALDVPEHCGKEPMFWFHPRTDYQNCRAADKRRLDVRGAVSIRIRMGCESCEEVISGISGDDIQLKHRQISVSCDRQSAVKTLSLNEDVPIGSSKPPVQCILRCSARAVQGECSVIAGKLVMRGELIADVLYRSGSDDNASAETMHMTLCQYSQIIDMENIDESFNASADAQVISFNVKPQPDSDGENRILSCSAEVRLMCSVCRTRTISAVTDAYSVKYPCSCTAEEVRADIAPVQITEQFTCSASVETPQSGTDLVYDLKCRMKNVSITPVPEKGKIRVCGMLCANVLAKGADGMPAMYEREEAFEELLPLNVQAEEILLFAKAEPAQCSYHLGADGMVSVKCSVIVSGCLYPSVKFMCLTDTQICGEKELQRDRDCAVRLYYGTAGESVWDIAKKCCTRVEAVMEENELQGDILTKPGMLLIPITD